MPPNFYITNSLCSQYYNKFSFLGEKYFFHFIHCVIISKMSKNSFFNKIIKKRIIKHVINTAWTPTRRLDVVCLFFSHLEVLSSIIIFLHKRRGDLHTHNRPINCFESIIYNFSLETSILLQSVFFTSFQHTILYWNHLTTTTVVNKPS